MNLYANSGKKLKKVVRILNPLGYLISDLIGLGAGILTALMLQSSDMNGFLASLICILVAGGVAAVPIVYVWVRGLIWWNISDTSEMAAEVQKHLQNQEME